MNKRITNILTLILVCVNIIGCTGEKRIEDEQNSETSVTTNNSASESSGFTLSQIRKSVEEAGYKVTDGHQLVFLKDVDDGFTVQIVADDQDVLYSIIDCKTEDAAIKNAKEIDDAGYNITIRNGKLLTCYGVDKKDGTIKDILASIMEGKPVPNKN